MPQLERRTSGSIHDTEKKLAASKMALNEIQMNTFSEGSTGTVGRVDELTLPVDNSHPSRLTCSQADANVKDLDSVLNPRLNLHKENVGAGSSGGSSEDVKLVYPVSESRSEAEVEGQGNVTYLEPIREEDQDSTGGTHQQVEGPGNTDHTETVEEAAAHICRSCGPDEEIPAEPDNLLVKLGCHCRGDLSRMHRKCILVWYGRRIIREKNYQCELCNGVLHGRIEHIVFCALIGQDSGKDILIKALEMRTPRPRRPRRNAIVHAQAYDGNAHPDFHQINIVEITHNPALGPDHPSQRLAQTDQPENRSYYGSARGGCPICVVVCILLVLIGLGVAGIGTSH